MGYDPTDVNALDRQQAKNQQQAKRLQDIVESDFKWLMGSRRGRRIVAGFLERSCIDKCVFDTNAMRMAFVSGRQVEGARIKELIDRLCPELYPILVKEQTDATRATDSSSADHNAQ